MKTINITIPFWVNILFVILLLLAIGNTKISLTPFYIKADWKRVLAFIFFAVAFVLWNFSISEQEYEKGYNDGKANTIKTINDIIKNKNNYENN